MGQLGQLFPSILLSMALALVVAPAFIAISKRIGFVDVPGSAPHKRHLHPTALSGGFVLVLAVTLPYLLPDLKADRSVLAILIASAAFAIWGALDDWRGFKPLVKIAGQIVLAAIPILLGIQVHVTQITVLDLVLTLLWFVGVVNAFNFVDTMDGLAVGLAAIAAAFFMLATLDAGQEKLATMAAVLMGSTVGIYFYNSSPSRVFLGDSGAQMLGISIALMGVAYVPAGAGLPQALSWFVPILVLGVPLFDMGLVVVSRIRRRVPLYVGQHDHTYHRLLKLGWAAPRSVAAMHTAAVLLGLAAFTSLRLSVVQANLLFFATVAVGVVCLTYLERNVPVG